MASKPMRYAQGMDFRLRRCVRVSWSPILVEGWGEEDKKHRTLSYLILAVFFWISSLAANAFFSDDQLRQLLKAVAEPELGAHACAQDEEHGECLSPFEVKNVESFVIIRVYEKLCFRVVLKH